MTSLPLALCLGDKICQRHFKRCRDFLCDVQPLRALAPLQKPDVRSVHFRQLRKRLLGQAAVQSPLTNNAVEGGREPLAWRWNHRARSCLSPDNRL